MKQLLIICLSLLIHIGAWSQQVTLKLSQMAVSNSEQVIKAHDWRNVKALLEIDGETIKLVSNAGIKEYLILDFTNIDDETILTMTTLVDLEIVTVEINFLKGWVLISHEDYLVVFLIKDYWDEEF